MIVGIVVQEGDDLEVLMPSCRQKTATSGSYILLFTMSFLLFCSPTEPKGESQQEESENASTTLQDGELGEKGGSMAKASWKQRLTSVSEDGWELASGEEQHKQYPDTFWIPDKNIRHNLKVGQAAKLLFIIEALDEQGQVQQGGERMWVVVSGKEGDQYLGILDNQPVGIEPGILDEGSELLFHAEHVIDVDTPPIEYLKEKYGDQLYSNDVDNHP